MKYKIIILLVFSFNIVCSQNIRKIAREGNKQYSDSLYNQAEISYRKSLSKNGDSVTSNAVKFNLTNSLYRQSKYDESIELLNDVLINTQDTVLKSEVYYNLGNNFVQQGKLEDAVMSYKNCLRIKPDDEVARYNLIKTLALLQQENQENEQNEKNQEEEKQNSGETDSPSDDSENDANSEKKNQNNNGTSTANPASEENKETSNQQIQDGDLSKEEIKRMLEALDREEKKVQEKMKNVLLPNKKKTLEKDW